MKLTRQVSLITENERCGSGGVVAMSVLTWSHNSTQNANATSFQSQIPNSEPLCNLLCSRQWQIQGQIAFAAPLHTRQTGAPLAKCHRPVHFTNPSIFPNRRRHLVPVQIGSLSKRQRSRIKERPHKPKVNLSMVHDVPRDVSSSFSNEVNMDLTGVEAPHILNITDKWVAVHKPPGILVHRTKLYKAAPRERYLTDYLSHLVQQETGVEQKVLPVQRLDRPTSGVMIFALGCTENAAELQAALKSLDCVKQYWALAFGANMQKRWVNDHPLKDIDGKEKKQRTARTEFEVIEVFDAADVVAVNARLTTGRRHQVRRHLSNSRHPILGDTSYCKGKLNRMVREIYGVERCCLHSQLLCFKDPWTGHQVSIHAPLPGDLRTVLNNIAVVKANTI